MSIQNYLIDHTDFNWRVLLGPWKWLMPPQFNVWLVNRFGDLFLVLPDKSIHYLDVGAGTLTRVADNGDAFCQLADEPARSSVWFRVPLVDELVAAGERLRPGQCYSYKVPPALGGPYSADNVFVVGIDGHYRAHGGVHEQLRRQAKQ